MNRKELDIELDKIHENLDGEILIPNTLIDEVFDRMIKREVKQHNK